MRSLQTRLYSFAAPLVLLPLMEFQWNEIPDWFRGMEFRTLFSEVLIQSITGFLDAILSVFIDGFFGVLG